MSVGGGAAVKPGKEPQGRFRGKLSSRGQVVIPQVLRQWAELREGTPLEFVPQSDGSILIRRGVPETDFRRLRGAWHSDARAISERLRTLREPSLEALRTPED